MACPIAAAFAPMLARVPVLFVVFLILGGVLVIYALYYLIFRVGKER